MIGHRRITAYILLFFGNILLLTAGGWIGYAVSGRLWEHPVDVLLITIFRGHIRRASYACYVFAWIAVMGLITAAHIAIKRRLTDMSVRVYTAISIIPFIMGVLALRFFLR